jgi:hypothetical protein
VPGTIYTRGNNSCQPKTATILATVTDSTLKSVTLKGDNDDVAMKSVGSNTYSAMLGPYFTARTLHLTVVAVDVAGHTTTSAVKDLHVVSC